MEIFRLKCVLIEFAITNLSLVYFFNDNSLNYRLNPVLLLQNNLMNLWVCLRNHKGYFVVKKQILLKGLKMKKKYLFNKLLYKGKLDIEKVIIHIVFKEF